MVDTLTDWFHGEGFWDCQKGLDFNGAVVQRILTKTIVIAAIYNRFFTCTQPVNDCTGVSSIRYAAILVFVEDADIFFPPIE